jgi:drug/metabolite transporter (DMT)-like permease
MNAEILKLAAIVFTAVTSLVIGDTVGKVLAAQGVAPLIIAWSRFVIGTLVILPFSGLSFKELHALKDWRILLRSAFITGGICCILTALKTEPVANVFGAFYIGPVIAYTLAILFLKEKPSALRSGFLALGFCGVMLVVKPSLGISIGMCFALASGTFYGAFLVMTRTVSGKYRPRLLLMSQLIIGTFIVAPLALTSELPTFTTSVTTLILVSAAGSALGNYLLVVASKMAEASLVAPLMYSQLLPATMLGILVFNEWPDAYSISGLCLIIASGVGTLIATQREKRTFAQHG